MKELILEYANYHSWANEVLFELLNKQPDDVLKKQFPGSFPSLYATALHMWNAESIWWQRIKLQERIIVPGEKFTGSMQELTAALMQQNKDWNDWIKTTQERMLEHVVQYQNSKKESFKQPVYQIIMHLFNHGTYHRGQLVSLLRQAGIEKIPSTDLINFYRKK